jgi:hypothetical protein
MLRKFLERFGGTGAVLANALALSVMVYTLAVVLGPLLKDPRAMGFHDWDSAASYRYITVLSLKGYGELPFWHPYLCGGFAAFGYGEAAPNLVSPFLPFYLLLPMVSALRVEIVLSALVSLLGTYALTARFTRSVAVRAFVASVYTLNGRWALQVASGHAWYLAFAWVPVAILLFERSLEPKNRYAVFAGGAVLALIVYGGGIYPLPHAALFLVVYAALRAVALRSTRPARSLVIMGVTAVGLAAPKLLAVADVMTRFSRRIESTETIGLDATWAMMTGSEQSFYRGTAMVPAYGWHEWGCYVGWYSVLAMALGLYFARGRAEWPLKVVGLGFVVLSLGASGPYAPWTLLHQLPVFASQHVPSRFIALAILALLLAFASAAERVRVRFASHPALDVLALVVVSVALYDMATVSQRCLKDAFTLHVPPVQRSQTFRQVLTLPYNYDPPGAWAGPSYPGMLANDGFVGCYSVPDRAEPKGAIPTSDPNYHGEAYVAGGEGHARIVRWSPNRATVAFDGVPPSGVVVYNMNFDPNWAAPGSGVAVIDHAHAVAFRPGTPAGEIELRYRPRTWWPSLAVLAVTLAAIYVSLRGRKGASLWQRLRSWRNR